MLVSFVSLNRVSDLFLSGRNVLKFPSIANSSSLGSQSPGLLLLHLQSTRARSISSQEQVQHQNAKNSQHRDQELLYFTSVNSNVTDNYSASVLIGGPQPLATPDGLQPLPSGWHNPDARTLDTRSTPR